MDNWVRKKNFIAYPYYWQRPANTEEWTYEKLKNSMPPSKFCQFVFFPWATLIDLISKKKPDRAQPLILALENAPPRDKLLRVTICQHINIKEILPWLHHLKITDVYWSHATNADLSIEGIRIHPYPLYPVNCKNKKVDHISIEKRGWLYSFIGAYDPNLYLSESRAWIFSLPKKHNSNIKMRSEWHYEKTVYQEQIEGLKVDSDADKKNIEHTIEYISVMKNSVFSLCPSGSGPNTIRLWESLGFGCIPVIISDKLRLPGNSQEWESACVFITEKKDDILRIPELLAQIASDKERLRSMQNSGHFLWQQYIEKGPNNILSQLSSTQYIYQLFH